MYLKSDKAYSQLDLIGEEFKKLQATGLEKLLYLLPNKYVLVKIKVPQDLYFRAEILVDDISDDAEIKFTQEDLVYLLYSDFLKVIKKSSNVSDFYQRLTVRKFKKSKIDEHLPEWTSPKLIEIPIFLPRKEALRGEVFLADLEQFYPDHPFKLEDVLEILYTDFLIEFKRGAISNVVEKILSRINNNQ